MTIDILTLFPEMFTSVLATSILKRAQEKRSVTIRLHQLRQWATDRYGSVDDAPYGGGPGMVLRVDVIDRTLADLKAIRDQKSAISKKKRSDRRSLIADRPYVVLMTPQGKPFSQTVAKKLAKKSHLILVAGHYEGFDERVRALVDEELTIGDYVLTGGELPAMVVVDTVVRLLPGVLGKDESSQEESFSLKAKNPASPPPAGRAGAGRYPPSRPEAFPGRRLIALLEYPQYTRPELYLPTSIPRKRPLSVPKILTSGHHTKIEAWRQEQAVKRTKRRRPDLLITPKEH